MHLRFAIFFCSLRWEVRSLCQILRSDSIFVKFCCTLPSFTSNDVSIDAASFKNSDFWPAGSTNISLILLPSTSVLLNLGSKSVKCQPFSNSGDVMKSSSSSFIFTTAFRILAFLTLLFMPSHLWCISFMSSKSDFQRIQPHPYIFTLFDGNKIKRSYCQRRFEVLFCPWSYGSKCGNPDRDCTENTRFCSAMSTKSEIVKVIPEKRLTPRFKRNPSV